MPIAHGHGARLVPLHRRIVLLVRSRTRGLAGVVVLMGLLSLTIRPDFILWIGGIVVSFVAIPLMLAASPRELTGATAALWLQEPVDELRFVLARFGETLLATVGVAVLFGLAWVLVGQGLGWDPFRPPILVLPLGALASLVIAAMAFGAAAWLPRGPDPDCPWVRSLRSRDVGSGAGAPGTRGSGAARAPALARHPSVRTRPDG